MSNTCRLCGNNAPLLKSHIIPKFIFDWVKKTSATDYVRFNQNIDMPEQDGLKLSWLCSKCEQIISTYEKYFADRVFYPLHENAARITYNNGLLKFAASIAWRILQYKIELNQTENFNEKLIRASNQALIRWHDYLFNKTKNPGNYELHFYNYLGIISSIKSLPNNIHRYLHRDTGFNLYRIGEVALVYIKLPGFIIIGYISLPKNNIEFKKTRICVTSGTIEPMIYQAPIELWEIIKDEAQKAEEYQKSISDRQKTKINEKYKQNLQRASESETIKALTKDIHLNGINSVFDKVKKKE